MGMSKRGDDKLKDIKNKIKASADYFRENCDRYHKFMKFVFDTSITEVDKTKLATLQKPELEFNILEALISRLRGEFSKQEPSLEARAADGVPLQRLTPEFIQTIDVVTAHLREIFSDATNDDLGSKVYDGALAGGFSVVKVFTEYVNEMSFEQCIKVDRVFDPTMTFFDPLSRDSHKGDGNYCGELFPKTKEEFIMEFGADAAKDIKFSRSEVTLATGANQEFNWSYMNQDQEICLVADYYEKESKRIKIVKLSNGHIINKKHYEDLLVEWKERNFTEQAPIILEERWSEIQVIVRYHICGEKILDRVETDYKYLPLVFVDGNSVVLRRKESGASVQMTRPYVYHAEGVQKLKNFSGQTVAAEIENMVMHKWSACVEGIPEDYIDAYQNPQQASVIVYNAYYKDDPDKPLPPPREIQRTPTPPIVEATFMGSDAVTQAILGSYDGVLGINGNQISGVAIQQGAMQSNAAALPYLTNYIRALNRIAQIIIDLIPKYYVTPRSLPVRGIDGKRSYQIINDPNDENSINMSYDPNDLQIKIEAGVNSAVQKQVALDQIIKMMQASQLFAQFINTSGLETIIDNMDIRGVDALKEQAMEFMKQQQQAQEEAKEKGDPMLQLAHEQVESEHEVGMANVEAKRLKDEGELSVATARVAVEKQKADTQFLQMMAQIKSNQQKSELEKQRTDSQNAQEAVELALKIAGHHHDVRMSDEGGNDGE